MDIQNISAILFTALLPVMILLFYMYRKDSMIPEPPGQLFKAFGFGVLSVYITLPFYNLFQLIHLIVPNPQTIPECFSLAFLGAAVPEELAKWVMLMSLLKKNKYFDEKVDGIVYAVFISMGFAAIENVLYLFENAEDFLSVGLSRALFSIPGHFSFAVLMGYYVSLVKFYPTHRTKNRILMLAAPILAHGIYDTLLFCMQVVTAAPDEETLIYTGLLLVAFLVLCHRMWKYANKRIAEHLARDREEWEEQ